MKDFDLNNLLIVSGMLVTLCASDDEVVPALIIECEGGKMFSFAVMPEHAEKLSEALVTILKGVKDGTAKRTTH